ncbi:MAG: tetratricopeptide repeat protein [Acidobacteriota bacterium]
MVGDYDRSEELLLKALTLRRRLLGEGSPKVADTLANLGAIQEETSRFEDALESYRNALAIYREDEPDSLAVANVLNNLGVLYLEMDRSPDAEQSHRRAARIREDRLGPRHPAVLESWRNLGESLVHQRRYGEALVYLRQALEASREVLGPDHPQVGHGVNNLGHALRSLGDWQEAEAAYRRAEDIYGQAMGSADHPWVAYPLTNLGLTYSDQGRYADAIRVLRRADAIRTARDVDELTLQTSRLYLGASLRAAGQLDDAEPLLRTAADRFEATASGGMLHRISLVELGLLSLEQGAPSEAQDLLELALDLSEEHRGPTATWAGAQFGLAQIARARGHEKRARRLAEEVFSVVEGLPADHRRRVDVGRFLDGP